MGINNENDTGAGTGVKFSHCAIWLKDVRKLNSTVFEIPHAIPLESIYMRKDNTELDRLINKVVLSLIGVGSELNQSNYRFIKMFKVKICKRLPAIVDDIDVEHYDLSNE